jgi:hypothetical protein
MAARRMVVTPLLESVQLVQFERDVAIPGKGIPR